MLVSRFTYIHKTSGFTLIELSIVLVIIGLIIGGILTGQDLISAAAQRAQIAQIEKYNTAVRTFQNKYGGLPGDLSANLVSQFGFAYATPRLGSVAQGDGNGILEGVYNGGYSYNHTDGLFNGETAWFWVDLSGNAGLIDNSFFTANVTPVTANSITYYSNQPPSISLVMPAGKIGFGSYIDVYSLNGINYYSLSGIASVDLNGAVRAYASIPVQMTYNIDKKADDGMPLSGAITAVYENWSYETTFTDAVVGAAGGGASTWNGSNSTGMAAAINTSAVNGSATTCYDNGGATGTQHYSIEQSGGGGANCALSFRFQ